MKSVLHMPQTKFIIMIMETKIDTLILSPEKCSSILCWMYKRGDGIILVSNLSFL